MRKPKQTLSQSNDKDILEQFSNWLRCFRKHKFLTWKEMLACYLNKNRNGRSNCNVVFGIYGFVCVWNCSLPGDCLADIPASQQLHAPASPLLCQSGGEWCRNILINVELLKVEVKTITAQFYFASSLSSLIFSVPPPSPLEGFISQTVNYNLITIF